MTGAAVFALRNCQKVRRSFPGGSPLGNPADILIVGYCIIMPNILQRSWQGTPGPSIKPFMRLDAAVRKGDYAKAPVQRGRIVNNCLKIHIYSETRGANVPGVYIHESEAVRR